MTQSKKFKGKRYYINPDRIDYPKYVIGDNLSITYEYQETETGDGFVDYDRNRKYYIVEIDRIRVVPGTVKCSIDGSKFKSINAFKTPNP